MELLIFLLFISFLSAKLEINIEGRHGWANHLPTWKTKNWITKLIWGDLPLTGYHFYFILLILTLLHFPFILDVSWSPSLELKILSMFSFFWMIEDFLWFVLNPSYSLKKFNKDHIPWHSKWLFGLPISYYKFTGIGLVLLLSSQLLQK